MNQGFAFLNTIFSWIQWSFLGFSGLFLVGHAQGRPRVYATICIGCSINRRDAQMFAHVDGLRCLEVVGSQ